MKRADFRLLPVEDGEVSGPPMSALLCGCVVGDIGGVWSPCQVIATTYARAVELARQGIGLPIEQRRHAHSYRWRRGQEAQPGFLDLLDEIARHVANGRRAETVARQRGLL